MRRVRLCGHTGKEVRPVLGVDYSHSQRNNFVASDLRRSMVDVSGPETGRTDVLGRAHKGWRADMQDPCAAARETTTRLDTDCRFSDPALQGLGKTLEPEVEIQGCYSCPSGARDLMDLERARWTGTPSAPNGRSSWTCWTWFPRHGYCVLQTPVNAISPPIAPPALRAPSSTSSSQSPS